MYAIVEVGSRQYKVKENEEILIEKVLPHQARKLTLDKVLALVKDRSIKIGRPYLKETKVRCEIIAQLKGKKKIAFKYRRRKSSESKRGHRQKLLLVKVKEIVTK